MLYLHGLKHLVNSHGIPGSRLLVHRKSMYTASCLYGVHRKRQCDSLFIFSRVTCSSRSINFGSLCSYVAMPESSHQISLGLQSSLLTLYICTMRTCLSIRDSLGLLHLRCKISRWDDHCPTLVSCSSGWSTTTLNRRTSYSQKKKTKKK